MKFTQREYEILKARTQSTPMKKIKESEAMITKAIREYLKWKKVFHWKVFQTLGATPGIPDIIGVLHGGRALFIEVKTAKGKLSEAQQNFIDNAERLGALAFVARGVNDVMAKGI